MLSRESLKKKVKKITRLHYIFRIKKSLRRVAAITWCLSLIRQALSLSASILCQNSSSYWNSIFVVITCRTTRIPWTKFRLTFLFAIFHFLGAKTFFSGSGPLVNRAMLVGAVQVGTYDQFREMFRGMGVTSQFSNVFSASMVSGEEKHFFDFLYVCVLFAFKFVCTFLRLYVHTFLYMIEYERLVLFDL